MILGLLKWNSISGLGATHFANKLKAPQSRLPVVSGLLEAKKIDLRNYLPAKLLIENQGTRMPTSEFRLISLCLALAF